MLAAAYRVRRRYFGNRVQLYFLVNAKTGLCPEDCGYCSQSKVSTADIPHHNLLSAEKLLDGARAAAERQAKTYCIVISARGPSEREMNAITSIVPRIKAEFDLKVCACLGLLDARAGAAAESLRRRPRESQPEHQRGVLRRRSARPTPTPTGSTRCGPCAPRAWSCARAASSAWARPIATWSTWRLALRELAAESIPVNFLNPIEGTPLAGTLRLNPRYCLKVLAMFRLVNPTSELRIAGGREMHLGSLQAMGLYPANSIFVGDYLTTKGQPPLADYRMIEELGFEIVRGEEPGSALHAAEGAATGQPGSGV